MSRVLPLYLSLGTACCLFAGLVPIDASAVVVCQKKNKVRLRPDTCKKKEVAISRIAVVPTGVWQHVPGGTLLSNGGFEPTFLTVGSDGRGRVNLRNSETGQLRCGDFTYSQGSALTVDLDDLGGVTVWLSALDESGGLTLSDAQGSTSSFQPVAAVDSAAECQALVERSRFEGLPRPTSFTGLVYDGTSLFYTENGTDLVQRVDPASGALGGPITLPGQFQMVHAAQGDDFWTHCRCGNVTDTRRVSKAGVVIDEINTTNDLGEFLSINAIAYDSGNGVLLLQGRNFDLGRSRLLRVDSDAEPDTLISAADFNVSIRGLTVAGGNLWAITHDAVLRIDPVSLAVTATVTLPSDVQTWDGIASVGPNLFLLGANAAGGVIVSFTP